MKAKSLLFFAAHSQYKGFRNNGWVVKNMDKWLWTLKLIQVVSEQTPTLVEQFVYEATNSELRD